MNRSLIAACACAVVVVSFGCGGAGANSGHPLAGERKQVDEASCNVWGDKFAVLTKAAFREDMSACLKKETGGANPKAEAKAKAVIEKKFSKVVDEQTQQLVQGCLSQSGKDYFATDADCYMNATKLKDWAGCNFGTPFFQDFAELGATFDKQVVASCEEGFEEGKKGHAEGDDDGDDD